MSLMTFQALLIFQACFNLVVLLALLILLYRLRDGQHKNEAGAETAAAGTAASGRFASHLESILKEETPGDGRAGGGGAAAPRRPAFSVRGAVSHLPGPAPGAGSGLPPRRTAPWGEAALPRGEAVLSRTLEEVRRRSAMRSA